jgi:hypothetical protein
VVVTETESVLGLETERTDDGAILVGGQLTTVADEPVPNAAIEIRMDAVTVVTVATDEEGEFEEAIPPPNDVPPGESREVEVTVMHADEGSNIEDARASVTMEVTSDRGVARIGETLVYDLIALLFGEESVTAGGELELVGRRIPALLTYWLTLAGLVAGVSASVYAVVREASGRRPDPDDEAGTASGGSSPSASPRGGGDADRLGEPGAERFDRARERLFAGDFERAIGDAYAAVRPLIETRLAEPPSRGARTPRELRLAYRSAGADEEDADALDVLTARFERAAFAPTPVSRTEATEAIAAAGRLLEGREDDAYSDGPD